MLGLFISTQSVANKRTPQVAETQVAGLLLLVGWGALHVAATPANPKDGLAENLLLESQHPNSIICGLKINRKETHPPSRRTLDGECSLGSHGCERPSLRQAVREGAHDGEVVAEVVVVAGLDDRLRLVVADETKLTRHEHADHLILVLRETGEGEEQTVRETDRPTPLALHRVGIAVVPALPARDVVAVLRQAPRLLVGEVHVLVEAFSRDLADREPEDGGCRLHRGGDEPPEGEPAAGALGIAHLGARDDALRDDPVSVGEEHEEILSR